jgi:hypothetical protein
MTVCIAALCQENGEARAIVAADRMVTLGGFIEFEHAVPKMVDSGSQAIAMIAGDTLVAKRLTDETITAATVPEIGTLAHDLAIKYDQTRLEHMEELHLRPRGLNVGAFYQNHQTLSQQIVVMLDSLMTNYNLGVEILLAGVDASGAHIYSISNPGGTERLHDIIGYAAIGSGAIHAIQAMIGFGHAGAAGYHETVYRAYAAKRRAEVAPGVGRDTDVAVISAAGIHHLSDDELTQLRDIYEDFETSTSKSLTSKLAKFNLNEGKSDGDDNAA